MSRGIFERIQALDFNLKVSIVTAAAIAALIAISFDKPEAPPETPSSENWFLRTPSEDVVKTWPPGYYECLKWKRREADEGSLDNKRIRKKPVQEPRLQTF